MNDNINRDLIDIILYRHFTLGEGDPETVKQWIREIDSGVFWGNFSENGREYWIKLLNEHRAYTDKNNGRNERQDKDLIALVTYRHFESGEISKKEYDDSVDDIIAGVYLDRLDSESKYVVLKMANMLKESNERVKNIPSGQRRVVDSGNKLTNRKKFLIASVFFWILGVFSISIFALISWSGTQRAPSAFYWIGIPLCLIGFTLNKIKKSYCPICEEGKGLIVTKNLKSSHVQIERKLLNELDARRVGDGSVRYDKDGRAYRESPVTINSYEKNLKCQLCDYTWSISEKEKLR